MATGIPEKNRSLQNGEARLVYPDKTPEREILEAPAAGFEKLHHGSSSKRLYFGDNLDVLRVLADDPDVRGRVTLVYIDPPFATRSRFVSRAQSRAYDDTLSGAAFVEFLRKRLVLLRELLSREGSIYLHLDEKMVFEMKVVMDEVFGARNYRNTIVRKKCSSKNYTRRAYGNVADFILFYTRTDGYVWNRQTAPLSEESAKEYRYVEEGTGRRFMKAPVHAPGTRNGETGGRWRGKLPPPGKHWQHPPRTLDEMDERGEIFWSKNGNPRKKVYLDRHPGVGVQDVWTEFRDAYNQNVKITGYPTEKNPEMLRRIISASSNPGDLVLDCFAGSGTTLAVADETGRDWIGADNSVEAVGTILRRFEKGLFPMGDFVSGNAETGTGDAETPSLFGPSGGDSARHPERAVPKHEPLSDFSIFSVKDGPNELYEAVDEWSRRNADRTAQSRQGIEKGNPGSAGSCKRTGARTVNMSPGG